MGLTEFSAPEPLSLSVTQATLDCFDCGVPALNQWLQKRALQNEHYGSSRTYVSLAPDGSIAGYFCISNSVIGHEHLSAAKRRNQPNPIPCCLLGRLAVDKKFQGKKLGGALLLEAVRLARRLSQISGCWALVVQPKTEKEVAFYEHLGFRQCKMIDSTPLLFFELHT